MRVRACTEADAEALLAIYGHACLHGFGTFEETPPSPAEMLTRRARVVAHDLPYLVAEAAGDLLGFAYAGPFRLRPAYRFTVEDSVYVAPSAQGRGVGRALLDAVVAACEARGLRRLVALVGDSGNESSLRLHQACGFTRAGLLPSVGYKHGRWLDVVWLERPLNGGDAAAPTAAGLTLGEP